MKYPSVALCLQTGLLMNYINIISHLQTFNKDVVQHPLGQQEDIIPFIKSSDCDLYVFEDTVTMSSIFDACDRVSDAASSVQHCDLVYKTREGLYADSMLLHTLSSLLCGPTTEEKMAIVVTHDGYLPYLDRILKYVGFNPVFVSSTSAKTMLWTNYVNTEIIINFDNDINMSEEFFVDISLFNNLRTIIDISFSYFSRTLRSQCEKNGIEFFSGKDIIILNMLKALELADDSVLNMQFAKMVLSDLKNCDRSCMLFVNDEDKQPAMEIIKNHFGTLVDIDFILNKHIQNYPQDKPLLQNPDFCKQIICDALKRASHIGGTFVVASPNYYSEDYYKYSEHFYYADINTYLSGSKLVHFPDLEAFEANFTRFRCFYLE